MKIHVLTLFPEMFPAVTESSILGRAGEKGILDIDLINIRDYTLDKNRRHALRRRPGHGDERAADL